MCVRTCREHQCLNSSMSSKYSGLMWQREAPCTLNSNITRSPFYLFLVGGQRMSAAFQHCVYVCTAYLRKASVASCCCSSWLVRWSKSAENVWQRGIPGICLPVRCWSMSTTDLDTTIQYRYCLSLRSPYKSSTLPAFKCKYSFSYLVSSWLLTRLQCHPMLCCHDVC